MAFEMKKTRKLALAAATAVLCLSGCATSSKNMNPRPGVVENTTHYVAFGCSPSRNKPMARTEAELNARKAIAKKISSDNSIYRQELAGSKVMRVYVNEDGHTCVEVEMPKPKTGK